MGVLEWLLGGPAWWFSVPAILGTAYFLVSLALEGMGGDADVDLDADSTGSEFRVLSLQTLSAFAMGSGWMGLAALRLLDLSVSGAVIVAVMSGVGVAWLLVWVLRSLMRLASSGNVRLGDTVGQSGLICVAVPPAGHGSGRVRLVINKRQREYNAVQDGPEAIASRTPVRVLRIDEASNTVTVGVA